jgi:hypothetical protein
MGVCSEKTRDYCPAPRVETNKATAITEHTAVLNGEVNPNGLETSCYFKWGRTKSYGNVTPTESVGSGTDTVKVRARITGLREHTEYHFRLFCTNALGTFSGRDREFHTKGPTPHHANLHSERH